MILNATFAISAIRFNGAEINRRIANVLGILLGPVSRKWVKFNPGLGTTLSQIIIETRLAFPKNILLKYTPRKPNYVDPK